MKRRTTDRLPLAQGPSLSGDGRYVAYVLPSGVPPSFNVFVRDRRRSTTTLVSRGFDGRPAGRDAGAPVISASGRFIAFTSNSAGLVRHDENRRRDVFVYDRAKRRIVWSTVGSGGPYNARAPSISATGRYVAFASNATDLVPGDRNARVDLFVRDLRVKTTRRVSVTSSGAETCVAHVPVWRLPCHQIPVISPDGRFVAFLSHATDIVPGDTNEAEDLFVHDTRTRETTLVSVNAAGGQICESFDDDCLSVPAISARGRFVAFDSWEDDVVPGDTNRHEDVFVRGPLR